MNTQNTLDRMRWYNLMMLGNGCMHARNCAETIVKHADLMSRHGYEACAGDELAKSELALTEALLAVQVARAGYERVTAENEAVGVGAAE